MASSSIPPRRGATDAQIFRRALGIGLAGLVLVLALVGIGSMCSPVGPRLESFNAPSLPVLVRPEHKVLTLEPLTLALRAKGFHECNPHDPLGLGPYSSYRTIAMGARMLIPQKGGHTSDMGYDVIVHFHGHEAARKMLVQVARGIVFVGLDKGLDSGPYADAFQAPGAFPRLRRSIVAALKSYSDDDRAHIRHLALSAWSAGYGAVNEILKHGDRGIDAVVLLDSLHAGWKPGHRHDKTAASASGANIQPVIDFARRAKRGEKIFIFTHSQVDPVTYPSTRQTADLLLSELGLERTPEDPGDNPFGMVGRVDVKGFHLWSYLGANKDAHCSHLEHLAPALAIIEGAWNTPAMDRNVPFHPAPKLGGGKTQTSDAGVLDGGVKGGEANVAAGVDGGLLDLVLHGTAASLLGRGSFGSALLDPGAVRQVADSGVHDPFGVTSPVVVPAVSAASSSAAPLAVPPR